jgi:hypothetical protein
MGPSDVEHFGFIKRHLTGRGFTTDADVKRAATSLVQTLDVDFFYIKIKALVSLWDTRLNAYGDYVGVWCVSSATHMPCIHRRRNKLLDIRGLPYF